MFILQSCPICFEEFDSEHKPHTIPCGHVFCRPCLDIVSSRSERESAKCAVCRAWFDLESVRIIIGTDQPKRETELWDTLRGCASANSQTRQLSSFPSDEELGQIGASENIRAAMNIMRLLFQAENATFESEITCQDLLAKGDKLSKRVAQLEARLELQHSLTINTSLKPSPRGKRLTESFKSTCDYASIPSADDKTTNSLTETRWEFVKHQNTLTDTGFSKISVADAYESPREWTSTIAFMRTPAADIGPSPSCTHSQAKRIPIAVVARGYQAKNANELSIDMGERLKFLPGANLHSHHGWIWCEKMNGQKGYVYAPRGSLRIITENYSCPACSS